MEPLLNSNPASNQFVRRRTRETRFLVIGFVFVFITGGSLAALFSSQYATSDERTVPQEVLLIPGIPPYAQSLILDPEQSFAETSLVMIPGVAVASLAQWKEITETGEIPVELLSAARSAQDMASLVENYAGIAGFSLSARRSSSDKLSYTFYRAGDSGELIIIPQSASTSQIIIKP